VGYAQLGDGVRAEVVVVDGERVLADAVGAYRAALGARADALLRPRVNQLAHEVASNAEEISTSLRLAF
jgi:hypothetical protein